MANYIYSPDCSASEAQQMAWERDDGKEFKITCYECGLVWRDKYCGQIFYCPNCDVDFIKKEAASYD